MSSTEVIVLLIEVGVLAACALLTFLGIGRHG
jgi:hypothetical protein